jgi:hypothetical protein
MAASQLIPKQYRTMCTLNMKKSPWLLMVSNRLVFEKASSKCIVKRLWTWVLFGGQDGLKKLQHEEQNFKTHRRVVALTFQQCLTTSAGFMNLQKAAVT